MTQALANKRHFATAKALWKLYFSTGKGCHMFFPTCGQVRPSLKRWMIPNKTTLQIKS